MRILHLLSTGSTGGIETLYREINNNSNWNNYFCFLFNNGEIAEAIRQNGGKIIDFSGYKKYSLRKLIVLYHFCIEENIEIITVNHSGIAIELYYILLLYLLKGKVKGFKIIHSCFEEKNGYKKLKNFHYYLIKKVFKKSAGIIAVSNAVKETYLNKFKIEAEKFHVVYNGISEYILKSGKKNIILKTPINITFAGRLVDVKGVDILITAFSKVCDKYDCKLLIAGDGLNRCDYEKLVNNYGISDKVLFLGIIQDMTKLLEKTSIFVYPSICKEAFGISVVEAMAFGIPCIASNKGGVPEIITNGENGFLLNNVTSNDLAEKIQYVINLIEQNNIGFISNNAKKTAEQFTILNTIESMNQVFKNYIINTLT